jgi:alpha-amylase/alpha-mannosidase (GH57 family)
LSSKTYICFHGHFYQPPRENPWLEAIERQKSAHPFHDWNERITDECYRPNAASRILDDTGRIARIVNNYASMSFNIGATLMSWLADRAPDVYRAIIEADRQSQARFGGHGSAIAQGYNHMIMPLANDRDRKTQVEWGLRDFEHHYGRKPEGMWLPETAVDTASLEALVDHGITYTILAPRQAKRVKAPDGEWQDVSAAWVDTRRAYRVDLPSGRSISVFFYDGPTSRAIAFEDILYSGTTLAERLLALGPGLVNVANDGESYGHHHRMGDMALAKAIELIEAHDDVQLVNYGEYLELEPATWQAEIVENSSWSCAHGIGRWKEDCGCHTGGQAGWNQRWRHPLREALDWVSGTMARVFEERGGELLEDPWGARDDYISIILNRSVDNVERFFERNAARTLTAEEMRKALELLEMQRHAQLMYTSCGWFFNELTGIETIQILRYAARAIELAQRHTGASIDAEFVDRLSRARSNIAEHGDGRQVWRTLVKAARVSLRDVVAHFAVGAVLNGYGENQNIHSYRIEVTDLDRRRTGKAKLVSGIVRAESSTTWETESFCFSALHLGEHHLTGGVRRCHSEREYRAMVSAVVESFESADMVGAQRELDRHFLDRSFSLKSLFRDQLDKVIVQILETPLREAEHSLKRIYDHNAPLIHFLAGANVRVPEVFVASTRFVLDMRVDEALAAERVDLGLVEAALSEADRSGVDLDSSRLAMDWKTTLERMAERLSAHPEDTALMERLTGLVSIARAHAIDVNLWRVQNAVWDLIQSAPTGAQIHVADAMLDGAQWRASFSALCAALRLRYE